MTKSFLENFAENKYFIGVIMITMNIGARFLIDELTPEQKKIINTQNFRRFIVFCAFFAATRDLLSALTLTIISTTKLHKEIYAIIRGGINLK